MSEDVCSPRTLRAAAGAGPVTAASGSSGRGGVVSLPSRPPPPSPPAPPREAQFPSLNTEFFLSVGKQNSASLKRRAGEHQFSA